MMKCSKMKVYTIWLPGLIDSGLTALTAQTGYIVPLKSTFQLKNEQVNIDTCWEYIQ